MQTFYSVEIMRRKLDPEGLGIILLSAFMDEFYSDEKQTTPDVFSLFHYNGLPHSCPDCRVCSIALSTLTSEDF